MGGAWRQTGSGRLCALGGALALLALTACSGPTAREPRARPRPVGLPAGAGQPSAVLPASDPSAMSVDGLARMSLRSYLHGRTGEKNDDQLFTDLELRVARRFDDAWDGFAHPRLRADLLDPDLRRYEPFEAWLRHRGAEGEVLFGQFIDHFPMTAVTNPISILNRRDFASDIVTPDRLGELGVRWSSPVDGDDPGAPTAFVYVIPAFRRTEFPTDDARFNPSTDTLGFEPERGFTPKGLDRTLFLARLQGTLETELASTVLQLIVSRGPEHLPDLVVLPGGPPELRAVYYGARQVGVGFRSQPRPGTLLAPLTLKGELVYRGLHRFSGSPIDAPDDYVFSVFGVNLPIADAFSEGDRVLLTVEYASEVGAHDAAADIRLFRSDLGVRASWRPDDGANTEVVVRTIYDVDIGEKVFDLRWERDVGSRGARPFVKLQLIDRSTKEPSFFGLFPNNSSAEVGATWRF